MHMDQVIQDEAHGQLSAADKKAGAALLRRVQQAEACAVAAAAAAEAQPNMQKRHPELVKAVGLKRRHVAAEQAIMHEHPGDARFSVTHAGPARPATALLRSKYDAMSVTEQQEVLRANEQLLSGSHTELAARCVDGELHGALPVCPTCGRGILHLHNGKYVCPGYFDTTASVVVRWCAGGSLEKLTRLTFMQRL